MNILAKSAQRKMLCLAILACLVVVATTPGFAVPVTQVFRNTLNTPRFSGRCCFSFEESVQIKEPATPVPVVVTWSTDLLLHTQEYFVVGLSINNGPCQFLGSASMEEVDAIDEGRIDDSRTFQWSVLPSDGLRRGTNTFTLCGGAPFSDTVHIFVGNQTLTVRMSQ